jgi:hypothetical protein
MTTAVSSRGLKGLPAASLISFSAGALAIGDDCCPQIASLCYRFGSIGKTKFEPGVGPYQLQFAGEARFAGEKIPPAGILTPDGASDMRSNTLEHAAFAHALASKLDLVGVVDDAGG